MSRKSPEFKLHLMPVSNLLGIGKVRKEKNIADCLSCCLESPVQA